MVAFGIAVVRLSGARLLLIPRDRWTVADVKEHVEGFDKIPPHEQRIFSGAQELGDKDILSAPVGGGPLELQLVRRPPVQAKWLQRVQQAMWTQLSDVLKDAPEEIRGDDEVMKVALKRGCYSILKLASPVLLDDRSFVHSAVVSQPDSFQFVSDRLRADPDIALLAVSQKGNLLQYATELQGNREVVLAAVQKDGRALQFARKEMQADREVAMFAVRNCGLALQFVEDSMKADAKIVLAAVIQNCDAFRYADKELRSSCSPMSSYSLAKRGRMH